MSSSTWTPRAVASEARSVELELWRAVEAQHVASTRRLVDSNAEQKVLEEVLERTKPAVSADLEKLHYLLSTPFRYPPGTHGSRFRSPADPGVFYAAEERRTACAEVGYWRWRFVADSAGLTSLGPSAQTLFRVRVKGRGVDLRRKPFVRERAKWCHPTDYAPTQALARAARRAPVALIRYESVRDPEKGGCAVLLDPAAFARRQPLDEQTWHLTVTRGATAWQRDDEAFEFRWE
ncbi:MAG TPA: RES family NAD+ phosphorylase [Burkholderiales bacterium]|nr:RES family NAD+ phosphorylase [Burkholderiales bacterium]